MLMAMHSAGYASGLVARDLGINVDGRTVRIAAIPMLGGGCQIRGKGTGKDAVVIEGAFIGSNTIVQAGTFVGFGSFVLNELRAGQGLLPFTVSYRPGPETDDIGAVLTRFSNIVMTHFIEWTYQAMAPAEAGNIVHLVNGAIAQGSDAIRCELDRRKNQQPPDESGPYAKYKSLPLYTDEQLHEGLRIYTRCLEQGWWDLEFDAGSLSFANRKGHWAEKNGHVRWIPR